jgi:flagellar FliL protein
MAEEKKEGEAEAPKKSKKLVIIVALVLVLILGGVGAFFALGSSDKEKSDDPFLEEELEEEGAEGHAVLPPAVLPLETFIVNLQVKGSFLRTTIQLEFAEPELPHTIENDVPKIKDIIIRTLSNKSSSELLMSDGKDKLRSEIRDKVNEVLGSEDITQVYFTEFIIQ